MSPADKYLSLQRELCVCRSLPHLRLFSLHCLPNGDIRFAQFKIIFFRAAIIGELGELLVRWAAILHTTNFSGYRLVIVLAMITKPLVFLVHLKYFSRYISAVDGVLLSFICSWLQK